MKIVCVKMKLLVKHAQAKHVKDLCKIIRDKGVPVSERTLYRWQKGVGISIPKFIAVTSALKYEDPLSLFQIVEMNDETEGELCLS